MSMFFLSAKAVGEKVLTLTNDNFDQYVMDTKKNVLVEFYAPCKQIVFFFLFVASWQLRKYHCLKSNNLINLDEKMIHTEIVIVLKNGKNRGVTLVCVKKHV